MANNLTEMIDKLLANGLLALRNNNVIPRTVNRDYDQLAAQRGAVINVPVPSSIAAIPVVPASTAPNPADLSPTSVPIVLDRWEEAPFFLTDKDLMELAAGQMPSFASEAIASLINVVEQDILSNYLGVFGMVGTPGTTPFSLGDVDIANEAGKILADQKAPVGNRWLALDTAAEAKAKNTRALQDASWRANNAVMNDGMIGNALGYGWLMNQNIPTHTAGDAAGYSVNGAVAIGAVSIPVAGGAGGFLQGDIVTFAGQDQTYVITADVPAVAAALPISPALREPLAGAEAVALKADHVVNLAYHRDAIALASRPVEDLQVPGIISNSASDPLSGIVLRVEMTREHKRTRFSYDALWGSALIRPELAVRVAG